MNGLAGGAAARPARGARPPQAAEELSPLQDPARWAELIQDVRPTAFVALIASLMSRSLRDSCSPEDVWQETLLQAWNSRQGHRWQGDAAFRGWLFEIARNRIRTAARRLETQKRGAGRMVRLLSELEREPSGAASAVLPPDTETPSGVVMRAECAGAIGDTLGSLPADVQPVVRMHLLEDLSMEVVAGRLRIGVSAAWRRFRKGNLLCARALTGRGIAAAL